MNIIKLVKNPYAGLSINFIFAIGNCVLGFLTHSWWFISVGAYYAVLAITRFSVLLIQKKADADLQTATFARRITGILLVILSVCIVGMNILSGIKDRGTRHHTIVMITIATYTFVKITIAIVGLARKSSHSTPTAKTLRNISMADACVSILSMQRSMLVSFPGMEPAKIQLFNILTGTAVWIIVLLLGINLVGGKQIDMAKSKIADVTHQIAETVTNGYKKIETGVVTGYKKIEEGVVGGYTKIEDKFIEKFLAHEDETIEEAKERLKK